MPEMPRFRCPECSSQKKFTSETWPLKHIKLHLPEHLQVAHTKNLSLRTVPRQLRHSEHHEYNTKKDSMEDLDVFLYFDQVEHISDQESQTWPPLLPQTKSYSSPSAPLPD